MAPFGDAGGGTVLKIGRIFGAAISTGLLLSGCATDELKRRYSDRWGPNVVIASDDVMDTINRQHQLMERMSSLTADVTGTSPPHWYDVTLFGFNYVDEKCDLYMHDLFVLNREHDRNDSILKKLDNVSTAIIGGAVVAAKAKIPLLVVAQSFGLIQGINDAVARTYLFEQVPGIIAGKVKEARLVYRAQVLKSRDGVEDETTSFRLIRDYLSLCLPQTIEGDFLTTYVNANSKPVTAEQIPTGKKLVGTPAALEGVTPAAAKFSQKKKLMMENAMSGPLAKEKGLLFTVKPTAAPQ